MSAVVIRRNNPYARSFEGSFSASFDGCHSLPPYQQRPVAGNVMSPPRLVSASSPTEHFVPTLPADESAFDVHSHSSESDEAPRPVRRSTSNIPSPMPTLTGMSPCSDFDAAQMAAFLASTGCPVDCSCPSGCVLTVYNGDISQHFNLPSESVQITRGSIKYADHRARYGSQTRFRFQLCNNYLHGKCAKLSECSYIHATALPKPSVVHLNPFAPRRLAADRHGRSNDVPLSIQDDPLVAETYETLPPGTTLKIYPPNDNGPVDPQTIPSEAIIVTAGALAAVKPGSSEHSHPRHCAHYQFKRLCNLGSQCHFIHSKIPFAGYASYTSRPIPLQHPAHAPLQFNAPVAYA